MVFDNKSSSDNYSRSSAANRSNRSDENESGAAFLVRLLQYLETPQYLRKALFSMHSSLRFVVGLLQKCDFVSFSALLFGSVLLCRISVFASSIGFYRVCCPHLMLPTICASMSGHHFEKVFFLLHLFFSFHSFIVFSFTKIVLVHLLYISHTDSFLLSSWGSNLFIWIRTAWWVRTFRFNN